MQNTNSSKSRITMRDPNLIDAQTKKNLDWWSQIQLGSLICHGLMKNCRHLLGIEDESYQAKGWVLGTSCFRGRRRALPCRCWNRLDSVLGPSRIHEEVCLQPPPPPLRLPPPSQLRPPPPLSLADLSENSGERWRDWDIYVRNFDVIVSRSRAQLDPRGVYGSRRRHLTTRCWPSSSPRSTSACRRLTTRR